jgi:K+-transporting ATPase ATPase C chain
VSPKSRSPTQANGSLVHDADGKVRGSSLIAQDFVGDAWFHPRPSAGAFATVSSSASNLAPSNPALATRVIDDANKLQVPGQGPVPLALLTTSGSGLDPHLPPAAIAYQLARVARREICRCRLFSNCLMRISNSRWWGRRW